MKKTKNIVLRSFAFLTSFVIAGSMAGCTKEMDCNITYNHAHKYVTNDGISTYRNSEKEHIGDLYWSEDIIEQSSEINSITKYNLLSINDNVESLSKRIDTNVTYTEYEYKYITLMPMGKTIIPVTRKNWTTDSNHSNLTGNMRDAYYKYHAYKTYTDKNGKVKTAKSEDVDDIFSIANEYQYFKLDNYYTITYGDTYTKESQKTK